MVETHPAVSDLQFIVASYERIDRFLGNLRDSRAAAGKDEERDRVARKRELNDQAWFVLARGQLETDFADACRDAIRHAQAHEDWRYHRAWSLYNPGDRRLSGLSFENRLALVLDKGSSEWKRAMQLYSVRNQIARCNLLSERIDVSSEIENFVRFRSSLVR